MTIDSVSREWYFPIKKVNLEFEIEKSFFKMHGVFEKQKWSSLYSLSRHYLKDNHPRIFNLLKKLGVSEPYSYSEIFQN